MPQNVVIQDTVSVAASTIVENIIAGNQALQRFQRCPFNAKGRFYASSSTTNIRAELAYSGKVVVEESDLTVRSGGEVLEMEDLLNGEFYVPEGAMFTLRANNLSAGAKSISYKLVLEPVDELLPDQVVTQRGAISIAAGNTGTQLLSGLKFEFPQVDSFLDIMASGSAAGLILQVFVNGQSIAPPSAVNPTNRAPRSPYDLVLGDIQAPEDKKIELLVNNPTGGALSIFWRQSQSQLRRL